MGTIYEIPEGARLRVITVSGKVRITGEARTNVEIEPDDRRLSLVEDDRVLETRAKSKNLYLRVPAGLNVSVGSVAGDVRIEGVVGSVKVSTVSGKVEIDAAKGDTDIRSISGTIVVGECSGRCRANTKSGRIEIGHVAGAINAHTMSGRIEVGTAGRDEVELKTISGSIGIFVDHGRAPRARLRSLSGKTRSDIPQGNDFDIKASSLSGSIEILGR